MTFDDANIMRLRELLARFYAGETSPDEEREALRLLEMEPLPEEFHADLELLRAVCSETPIPNELYDRTDRLVTRLARRSRIVRIVKLSTLAAAVAAVIICVLIPMRQTSVNDVAPDVKIPSVEPVAYVDEAEPGADSSAAAEIAMPRATSNPLKNGKERLASSQPRQASNVASSDEAAVCAMVDSLTPEERDFLRRHLDKSASIIERGRRVVREGMALRDNLMAQAGVVMERGLRELPPLPGDEANEENQP